MTLAPTPIVPTAATVKWKYPQFRGIDDGTIEFAIEQAVIACGSGSWVNDANRTLGLTYLTAHLLQVSLMRQASGTGQLVSSERTPDLSVNYTVGGPAGGVADYNTTEYGIRFADLVKKNFPAVLTVNAAVSPPL